MNAESMLKLQSWVDGELPEAEARQVAQWVAGDREAQALAEELKMTRGVLAGNELQPALPESREFYWSKIERAIEQAEAAATTGGTERLPWILAFRRLLVPLGGFAVVALVTVLSLNVLQRQNSLGDIGQLVEVENLSENVDSMSYKSQSENMFVVYVFNKETASEPEEDADWDLIDDSVIQ